MSAVKVADALRAGLVGAAFTTEDDLQVAAARVLSEAGIDAHRERVLSRADRIDVLTDDGVGVEVKIGGSAFGVFRQLERYSRSPLVRSLVLLTTAPRHAALSEARVGVPLTVVLVDGGGFA